MFHQKFFTAVILSALTVACFLTCTEPNTPEALDATDPTPFRTFKQIAHVSIKTKDLNQSIAYYSKLGFTVVFRFTRGGIDCGAYLQIAPGSYIEIFEDKDLGPVVNNGIAHFCIEAESIDSVIEKLTAIPVPFTPKKLGCDSTWQIWLTDPDGNQFEVHQYTENSMQLTTGGSVEVDW